MNITVEGVLQRNAEARMTGRDGWLVVYLIGDGPGLPVEVREFVGHGISACTAADAKAATRKAGMRVRATGGRLQPRTDHDVAAILLLDVGSVTTV